MRTSKFALTLALMATIASPLSFAKDIIPAGGISMKNTRYIKVSKADSKDIKFEACHVYTFSEGKIVDEECHRLGNKKSYSVAQLKALQPELDQRAAKQIAAAAGITAVAGVAFHAGIAMGVALFSPIAISTGSGVGLYTVMGLSYGAAGALSLNALNPGNTLSQARMISDEALADVTLERKDINKAIVLLDNLLRTIE